MTYIQRRCRYISKLTGLIRVQKQLSVLCNLIAIIGLSATSVYSHAQAVPSNSVDGSSPECVSVSTNLPVTDNSGAAKTDVAVNTGINATTISDCSALSEQKDKSTSEPVNNGKRESVNTSISTIYAATGDVDGDGIANYLDNDSDGDGIADAVEGVVDTDADGIADYLDTDSDGDGLSDFLEAGTNATKPSVGVVDSDADRVPDYLDLDSDNDGVPDSVEARASAPGSDTDGDGIPDYRDTDSDGDGIDDLIEVGSTPDMPVDTDGDNTPDYLDTDSDKDGISDIEEGNIDSDGDGIADYQDLDSDNDGLSDALEGVLDSDGDQTADYVDVDSDNDGIADGSELDGDAEYQTQLKVLLILTVTM